MKFLFVLILIALLLPGAALAQSWPLEAPPLVSAAPAAPAFTLEVDTYNQQVLELVNAARWDNGQLPPLKGNPLLEAAATTHSSNMANRNFFAHCDLDTKTSPGDRIEAAGYDWYAYGENIAAGYSTPEDVMNGWMNSSGHRANILSSSFRELGVGYVYQSGDQANIRKDDNRDCSGDGTYAYAFGSYWTQNFGRTNTYPLVINREAVETSTRAVNLYIYGTGWAAEMRLRNESGDWGPWQPFQADLPWTLSAGAGEKTVQVELRSSPTSAVYSSSDTILSTDNTPVTPTAALAVAQPQVGFGFTSLSPATQASELEIANTGTAALEMDLVLIPQVDWLALSASGGSLAAGESTILGLTASRTGLPAGVYQTELHIDAGPAEGSPAVVTITLLITEAPPVYLPGLRR